VIKSSKKYLDVLDLLRGIAAMAVCFIHIPKTGIYYIDHPISYFWLGVEIFFVISGFVIPWSMSNNNYQIKDFGNFMVRRFVRLAPPAYFSILLTFLQYFGTLYILGKAIKGYFVINTSAPVLIANFTFTIPFTDYKWYNPIFWTLAIEFQYYIYIGLIYVLLVNSNNKVRYLIIIFTFLLSMTMRHFQIPMQFFLYVAYFLLGNILFLYKTNRIGIYHFIILTLLICSFGVYQTGIVSMSVGFVTFLVILLFQFSSRIGSYMGKISYSVYLTHIVISIFAQAVLKRIIPQDLYQTYKILLLFVYAGICILFAHYFFIIVEKPFIRLSGSFRKDKKMKKAEGASLSSN
jgi:peptidoglycan/LPS O-acetylase OafA/YrhL